MYGRTGRKLDMPVKTGYNIKLYSEQRRRGMNPKLKKILSTLFIVLSVAAVFCIAFGNPELSNAWDALRSLDTRWRSVQ